MPAEAGNRTRLTGGLTLFVPCRRSGRNQTSSGAIQPGSGSPAGWPWSLQFVDPAHGWLFVNQGAAAGSQYVSLYGTVDGGTTWTKLSETDPNDATGGSRQVPFGCDKGAPVFVNSDGGQHWSTAGTIPPNSNGVVMDFQFVTPLVGWALGADSRSLPILKTVDGGRTWTTQLAP